ncbi:hypothetical protein C3E97_009160 [Pseudomonas sp. MWU12-2115]|nr:hypothetical protein C3E97_009160 [Pseudomonas sp. MWU12-2115]
MWERACSRRGRVIRHHRRLTLRLREQAHSHQAKRFAMQPDNGGHPWPVIPCSVCHCRRRH